jgi:O-antigen/teichoic acid export membrane protein
MKQTRQFIAKLFQSAAIYAFVGRAVQYASQLAIVVVLPLILQPDYYVQFNLLLPVALLMATLIFGWFSGAVYRHVHDFYDAQLPAYRQTACFYYGMVSLAILLCYAISVPWLDEKFRLILLLIVASGLKSAVMAILNASERHRAFFLASVFFAVALSGFLLLCLFGEDGRLLYNLAIYAAADIVIATAFMFRIGIFTVSSLPRFHLDIGRKYFYYGLPLMMNSFAGWVMSLSDRYFLAIWRPTEEIAAYILSYQLGASIVVIPMSFLMTIVFPRIIRMDKDSGIESALRYTYRLMGRYVRLIPLAAVAGTGLVIFLIHFFYPAYQLMPVVIVLIVLAHLIQGVSHFYHKEFELSGRTFVMTKAIALGALVNVGFNIALIPFLGAAGAAIATLVAYMASVLFVYKSRNYVFRD